MLPRKGGFVRWRLFAVSSMDRIGCAALRPLAFFSFLFFAAFACLHSRQKAQQQPQPQPQPQPFSPPIPSDLRLLNEPSSLISPIPVSDPIRVSERSTMSSSFSGTLQKCKVCEKTVYVMDELIADGVVYHKPCFKCNHCKGTLQLSNYSSLEGVLYCKPHFEQLFKETGSFNKSFQSLSKSGEKLTPELTRSPSKAAGMFSGTQDKCATCGKTAYPLEKVTVEGEAYHKSCFKCSYGGCSLTTSSYAAMDGILYCKHHFAQLFKEKGSYNHLLKCASMKQRTEAEAAPVPDL